MAVIADEDEKEDKNLILNIYILSFHSRRHLNCDPSSCTFHKLSLSCSNQVGNTFESQEKNLDIRESGQSKCSSFLLTHILVGSCKRPDLDTLLNVLDKAHGQTLDQSAE